MIGDVLGLVMSLAVLVVAGDQFVIGSARVARGLRVRPTVIGAVVGGLGTSLPELMVSGVASLRGSPQIAIGNLVGSIIANLSLALGIAALVSPLRVDSRTVRREAPLSVAAVLLFAVVLPGGLGPVKGVMLIVALVLALVALTANARLGSNRDELALEVRRFFGPNTGHPSSSEIVRAVASLGFMLAGSELLVRSASGLAGKLGISQGFVGLAIVAVGTSAPLVALSIQAARRKNDDLVVGAVLGGNLFIALGGGAIVGLLHGTPNSAVGAASIVMMVGVAAAAWGFMARGRLVNRWEAGILIAAYGATLLFAGH